MRERTDPASSADIRLIPGTAALARAPAAPRWPGTAAATGVGDAAGVAVPAAR
ncbi:hypothetical protein [Micromonospora sp. KLBMP9576]|uniref:hypothetical protein n=1 Tax=Micromonospora sp. KLBMP9576 TaxID=3424769 RepID=UPI003D8F4B00